VLLRPREGMQVKLTDYEWRKTLWKILTNPTAEVMLAIVVVLVATWFVVTNEADRPGLHIPFAPM
jgi:hypothetical protein